MGSDMAEAGPSKASAKFGEGHRSRVGQVDLSDNGIGDEGVIALVEFLLARKVCPTGYLRASFE